MIKERDRRTDRQMLDTNSIPHHPTPNYIQTKRPTSCLVPTSHLFPLPPARRVSSRLVFLVAQEDELLPRSRDTWRSRVGSKLFKGHPSNSIPISNLSASCFNCYSFSSCYPAIIFCLHIHPTTHFRLHHRDVLSHRRSSRWNPPHRPRCRTHTPCLCLVGHTSSSMVESMQKPESCPSRSFPHYKSWIRLSSSEFKGEYPAPGIFLLLHVAVPLSPVSLTDQIRV